MNRRKFIQQTGALGIVAAASPSLFSSALKTPPTFHNHLFILSGGVRLSDFMDVWTQQKFITGYNLFTQIHHESFYNKHLSAHQSLYRSIFQNFAKDEINLNLPESDFLFKWKNELRKKYNANNSTFNQPLLHVHHIEGFDVAHYTISAYQNSIHQSIKKITRIWNKEIQSYIPGNKIRFTITTDMGRNDFYNEMGGLDHHSHSAETIFALTFDNYSDKLSPVIDQSPYSSDHIGDVLVS